MKTGFPRENASVLMVAMLTITILTMICATSMYITSQNTNAGSQTASWQQALAGAEGAVDQAMNALNKNSWTSWYNAADLTCGGSDCLPSSKPVPTGTPNATGTPAAHRYNYLIPATLAMTAPASGTQNESGTNLSSWVTVDTAGLSLDHNGYQPYRIRATGVVGVPGPRRVSNQKLDNDLRKLSLFFDRFSGTAATTPQAARRIEVIATPVVTANDFSFVRAITTNTWTAMTGSGSVVDSFDSSNPFKSTNGQYDVTKRQSHGDIGLVDSSKNNNVSDLSNNLVYGNLQYSGPAVKRTSGVKGTVSTPFTATFPPASDPTGTFTAFTSSPNNQTVKAAGTSAASPTLLKVNGDFSLQHDFNIVQDPAAAAGDKYITIWVTGSYNTTGQGVVTQASGVHVTWYVDGSISTAGGAYVNQSNYAANLSFIAVGSGSITISGSGSLIGTFYGPGRDVTFSGNGSLMGAVVGNDLKITSGASVHYDEALAKAITFSNPIFSNYAYASWFEDNSDVSRNITY